VILDTNALSAMADGDAQLQPVVQTAAELALPVITLGEYRFGIRQSRYQARYEKWLTRLVTACRVLAIDKQTAEHYAEVRDELKRKGKPIPGNDLWIAALVRQYGLPLLSRDAHFDAVPKLKRIGW
jgi:tRNA(fMet)-specific endonuclease VapC